MGKSVEAPVTPEILKWARVTRGFSIGDVAEKLKKKPDFIESLENGDSRPSYSLLEKLAYELYKRPIAIFFMSKAPELDDLEKDFRTLPGTILESISPEVRLSIRKVKFRQMVLNEMSNNTSFVESPIFRTFEVSRDNPHREAQRLRGVLNFDSKPELYEPRLFFNYVRDLVEKSGIFVFQEPLPLDKARGFSLMDQNFPIIVVSSFDHPHGKIFTIFHEICHILFNTGGIFRDIETQKLKKDSMEIEVFCNQFAADFLISDESLKNHKLVSSNLSGKWDDGILNGLSSEFHVSREVILRKLLKLGLTTQAYYELKRKEWSNFGNIKKEKKGNGGPSYYRKTVSQLGRNYTTLVLENLYSSNISPFQASQYLNVKINHIQNIENEVFA